MLNTIAILLLTIAAAAAAVFALLSDELKAKPRMKWVIVAVLLLITACASMIGLGDLVIHPSNNTPSPQPTATNPSTVNTYAFTAKANAGWQRTDIIVHKGETLVISLDSGEWSACAPNGCPYVGAEGTIPPGKSADYSRSHTDNITNQCLHLELIGRIYGSSPFCAGNGIVIEASSQGELEFRANDSTTTDNEGAIQLTIKIIK